MLKVCELQQINEFTKGELVISSGCTHPVSAAVWELFIIKFLHLSDMGSRYGNVQFILKRILWNYMSVWEK